MYFWELSICCIHFSWKKKAFLIHNFLHNYKFSISHIINHKRDKKNGLTLKFENGNEIKEKKVVRTHVPLCSKELNNVFASFRKKVRLACQGIHYIFSFTNALFSLDASKLNQKTSGEEVISLRLSQILYAIYPQIVHIAEKLSDFWSKTSFRMPSPFYQTVKL